MRDMVGRANPRWNNGDMLSSHGYRMVRVGVGHPLADPKGYAYEHVLVWVAAGRKLKPGYLIHHANEDKTDNRIENLEQVKRADHSRHHAKQQPRDAGRFAADVERCKVRGVPLEGMPPDSCDATVCGMEKHATRQDGVAYVVARRWGRFATEPHPPKRCAVCGWPIVEAEEGGCATTSCSYRPAEGSDEWHRIKARRAVLEARR